MAANLDRLRAAARALVDARRAAVEARALRDQEIAAATADGASVTAAAEAAGISRAGVRKALRRVLSGAEGSVQDD